MENNPVTEFNKPIKRSWWEVNKMWRFGSEKSESKHQINLNLNRMWYARQVGIWIEGKHDGAGWISWIELNMWWARFKFQVIW